MERIQNSKIAPSGDQAKPVESRVTRQQTDPALPPAVTHALRKKTRGYYCFQPGMGLAFVTYGSELLSQLSQS